MSGSGTPGRLHHGAGRAHWPAWRGGDARWVASCPVRRTGVWALQMKKKKRRARPSGDASDAAADAPASDVSQTDGAPRVDRQSSIGLKYQLWFIKEKARREAAAEQQPANRTKFRKRKEKSRSSSSDFNEKNEAAYVRVPKGRYNTKTPPIMIVDGYNVIGYWEQLTRKRDSGDLQGARAGLNQELREYCALRTWDCVVVYDAQFSKRRGTTHLRDGDLDVVFTGEFTADTYIEKRTKELVDQNTRQVWAVTSDYLQQKMTYGNGAHIMSAGQFVQEVSRTRRQAEGRIRRNNDQLAFDSAGKMKYALSEETLQRLQAEYNLFKL